MNLIAPILFIAVLVGAVAAYFLRKKKRREKNEKFRKKAREKSGNFIGPEKQAVSIADEILYSEEDIDPEKTPVTVIRSPEEKIPSFRNRSWRDTEREIIGRRAAAFYHRELGRIFIKRYHDSDGSRRTSLARFIRLYIHEKLHTAGYTHGDEMTRAEKNVTGKTLDEMESLGLHTGPDRDADINSSDID